MRERAEQLRQERKARIRPVTSQLATLYLSVLRRLDKLGLEFDDLLFAHRATVRALDEAEAKEGQTPRA